MNLTPLDPNEQYCDGNGLCLKKAAAPLLNVCEICDTPEKCRGGQCPCDLSGEFIAPVPVDVANHLLAAYRAAMNVEAWQDLNGLSADELPDGPAAHDKTK